MDLSAVLKGWLDGKILSRSVCRSWASFAWLECGFSCLATRTFNVIGRHRASKSTISTRLRSVYLEADRLQMCRQQPRYPPTTVVQLGHVK